MTVWRVVAVVAAVPVAAQTWWSCSNRFGSLRGAHVAHDPIYKRRQDPQPQGETNARHNRSSEHRASEGEHRPHGSAHVPSEGGSSSSADQRQVRLDGSTRSRRSASAEDALTGRAGSLIGLPAHDPIYKQARQ